MLPVINIKSEYDFLSSFVKLDQLMVEAKAMNLTTIGIADFKSTRSLYRFYHNAKKHNLKPLLGVVLEFSVNQKIVNAQLIAQTESGYHQLINLTTLNIKEPLILINKITDNFIICDDIDVDYFKQFFDDVIPRSEVIDDPVLFLKEADFETFVTLKAIKHGSNYFDQKKVEEINRLAFLKPIISDNPVINKQMAHIIAKTNFELNTSFEKISYRYIPENFESDTDYLMSLAKRGLEKRLNGAVPASYQSRLAFELTTIIKMEFAAYFLIVYDIVKFARLNKIMVGAGRGSAGGSLVAFALGITEIDPIKYNLIFERFLNIERKTMPDIDIDFDSEKRSIVIDYIFERFGTDHAALIGITGTYLAKSAIRDVAKAKGLQQSEIDYLTKNLDS